VLSLSLSVATAPYSVVWCVVECIRQLEVRRVTILTRFGLSFFFDAPFSLLAVFNGASAFNQDVSKWITGAVTTMERSKCTLSPF
jgi:surface protein